MSIWRAIVLAGLMTVSAQGTTSEGDVGNSWSDPNVLRIAVFAPLSTTEPARHLHGTDKAILHHVAEGLVALRADLTVGPSLAESFDVSADGLVYTFKLRRGATFHNGAPLAAEDVRWVWSEYYLNSENDWDCLIRFDDRNRSIYDRTFGAKIVSVDALDEFTVVFRIDRPSSVFLTRLADTSCQAFIFHRDSLAADGSWERPIGTGPYTMVTGPDDEIVRLRRFESYRSAESPTNGLAGKRTALVEYLEFVPIADEGEQVRRFLNKEIDILDDLSLMSRDVIANNSNARLLDVPQTSWWTLLMQNSDPVLGNKLIRQAIAHAIDAEEIAQVVTDRRQHANPSIVMPMSPFHSSAHELARLFDPERARELLAAAGYKGELLKMQTSRMPFPEMYYNALLMRRMLRDVGLNVELEVLDWETQLADYRKGEFQLSSFGYGGRDHPTLAFGLFTGSKDTLPLKQWDNPAAERLVFESLDALDEVALQESLDQLHQLMLEDMPMVPLYPFEQHAATAPGIDGFEIWVRQRSRLWGVAKRPAD